MLVISIARVASVVLLEAPFDPGAFRLRALVLFPLPVRHQHLGLEAGLQFPDGLIYLP